MRLLLSVSLAGFALVGACERSTQEHSNQTHSSTVIDSGGMKSDTIITESTHNADVDSSKQKEIRVITHGSPNQAYVDSVKAAKRKSKFE